jgi:predicted DCC family thiol-disulfide oxidoreductase YuxK
MGGWVLFFDGECAVCSHTVRWVARLDRRGRVDFAPLQGKLAREMALERHADPLGGTVVVLRESDGCCFYFSDALIELANAMGGKWRIFGQFGRIPKAWRDTAYRWIARNRYRIAGKSAACELPDASLAARMRE